MGREIALRIVVLRPPEGVVFRVQRGRDGLLDPVRERADTLVFEFPVRVGTPDDRFVYVNSGTLAGQLDSCWTRRAKVRFAGIGADLVARALETPGAVLQARIEGTGRDGGPACAGVPLLEGGWTLTSAEESNA